MLAAHACFAWGLWAFKPSLGRLLAGLAPSFGLWGLILTPWLIRWRAWSPERHEAGMYHALAAWAVTDLSLLFLMWPR